KSIATLLAKRNGHANRPRIVRLIADRQRRAPPARARAGVGLSGNVRLSRRRLRSGSVLPLMCASLSQLSLGLDSRGTRDEFHAPSSAPKGRDSRDVWHCADAREEALRHRLSRDGCVPCWVSTPIGSSHSMTTLRSHTSRQKRSPSPVRIDRRWANAPDSL